MNLGRFVSTQKRAVLLVIALLSIGGLMALMRIPRALFPQTDFPRIIIVAENGVAPAQQTLVSVTRPIEEAMSGIPGIARIKSLTARGSSEIDLFFGWRSNIQQTLQLVQTKVALYDEYISEMEKTPADEDYLRQHRGSFGSRPIRVLTSGNHAVGHLPATPNTDPTRSPTPAQPRPPDLPDHTRADQPSSS